MRQASLFSQILKVFNRNAFAALVVKHGAERYSKGFTSWTHFVSMLFCQLAQAKSLREICGGLACTVGKLRHLGVLLAPNKSTLSYANRQRPHEFFRDLFYQTLDICRSAGPPKHRFNFRNKLLSLDSTTISLCLALFPWADYRRTKGAVKLHLLLDHDGYLPTFACVTNARKHDVTIARKVSLAPGSIIAVDRAYSDFALLFKWTMQNIFFVTRLKENVLYDVVEERPVPKNRNILEDQIISLAGYYTLRKYPVTLRRVVVWDAENDREIVLLTNHLDFGATTISSIYKERWQIEIFFKTLKQNLKVKTFVGTSENALLIQIWTALLTMLLIKFLKFKSRFGWALSNLVAFIRWNLFTYRDLWEWLDNPFDVPPLGPEPVQYELFQEGLGQHR
jgi:hypothetical protein